MTTKENKDSLISDSGIIENAHTKQARIFVGLCHVVSLILIVLGIIAFYKGNF